MDVTSHMGGRQSGAHIYGSHPCTERGSVRSRGFGPEGGSSSRGNPAWMFVIVGMVGGGAPGADVNNQHLVLLIAVKYELG